jgi:hypothetical protein
MNNYLSRTYNSAASAREPWDALHKIPLPTQTVQFLLMTETSAQDFHVSDHQHVESSNAATHAPARASVQVHIHKWGGPPDAGGGQSNYSFRDGHASTLRFDAAYTDPGTNPVNPGLSLNP